MGRGSRCRTGGGQFGNAVLAQAQLHGERGVQAQHRVVEPLRKAMQKCEYARLGAANLHMGKALARLQELKAGGALQAVRLRSEVLGDFVLRLGDELRCGGGRGRAQVGSKVGDREIGFMADGGNDGQARCRDSPGHALAVEGSQIFKRTAAAREHDQVDEIAGS